MSDTAQTHDDMLAGATREEIMAALFANMVIQQTNMAMMMLGKVAHPETGEIIHDIDAARMFIDQLEMLEAKTKGNLSKQEDALLKQSLTALRMAFVEAVEGEPGGKASQSAAPPHEQPAPHEPAPAASKTATTPAPVETPPEESRKKFSKKY